MIRIISDCSACGRALVPLTVLFLSSCGGGSTATDAAPATALGTVATVSGEPPCGIEGSGHAIQSCNPNQFTATGTIPTINYLDPSCAPVGGQGFTLGVGGGNLVASSVVRWNGSDRPTTVDGNFAEAQIPASDIAAAGTAAVTVFNPAPGGGSSNTSTFTLVAGGGGVAPRSVAVDPTGKFAYVANTGCWRAFAGNVSMYTINPTTGALTSIGSPVAANIGPVTVTVDPSGKFAYVANWGKGGTAGSISIYTINATTGALTPVGLMAAGKDAASVVVDPTGKFAYVANAYPDDNVSMYTINATTGALTSIGTIAADPSAPSIATEIAIDPSGKFAYVASDGCAFDIFEGSVSMYTINSTTGTLTSIGSPVAASWCAGSVTVDPFGKFAYVTNEQGDDVSMYTINAATGALTSIGTIVAGTGPVSVTVDRTGKFAYVANSGSNNVSMYTINATTGALTSIGTIAAGLAPTSIAIDPSGKFAYVTNSDSSNVSMYSIDAARGVLTLIGTVGT